MADGRLGEHLATIYRAVRALAAEGSVSGETQALIRRTIRAALEGKPFPQPPPPAGPLSQAAWKVRALDCLRTLARGAKTITADDVWEQLGSDPFQGARSTAQVFNAAIAQGLVRRTDQTQPSRRRLWHGRTVRIWESRIFDDPELVQRALGFSVQK